MDARPQVAVIHPTGNRFVRETLRAFEDAGILQGFYTTIAWQENSFINKLLPKDVASELKRRSYAGVPPSKIHQHPFREALRLLGQRLPSFAEEIFSTDDIYNTLDLQAAKVFRRKPEGAVYAYEDGAEQVFRAAKQHSSACIYDLPIGYWRYYHRLVAEEHELQPEWSETLGGLTDGPAKLAKKDRELELADCIIVASSFTSRTLSEYPQSLQAPVHQIGYGAPVPGPERVATSRSQPLRVLYAGSIGQRKGIGYLVQALDRLTVPYTFTLLGRPTARPRVLEQVLARHTWISSVPHERMLDIMREHDVLVLPSLFEGYGLVITEAMAQGTVVIATPNTAAPDIMTEGEDGFIVPIRSAESIAAALTRLAEDRDLLLAMSRAAQATAATLTWDKYRHELVNVVAPFLR
jgi:alpha-maltose-1-phosphate synthase